jgi:Coatomer gamma subunit appendage platform subdomain
VQSSAPVELTEAETEYAVNVVKHIYDGHVVLQFNCSNTIPEQLLENVRIHPMHMQHKRHEQEPLPLYGGCATNIT